ncbi:MAG TPA: YhjD/YihY/BrkB family envelope integrity protein [Jatrophihabitans sp.]|nr:YhjD/YihY/BrkB family envelope integrity protein [Jatrophihabitans sp.]
MTDARQSDDTRDGTVAHLAGEAKGRWQALQDRHGWVRHVVAAWQLMSRNNANQYAAAITYFSFLALFPLLLLAVSITGFLLQAHPAAEQDLFNHITDNVPGDLGTTLKASLRTAIDRRASLGIVGLAGVLLAGLGWIGNLRNAIDGVWGRTPAKRKFVVAKVADGLVLIGLGVGALLSMGLTVVGTSLTDQILRALNLDSVPGSSWLTKLLGIAIAVAGDMIIFWWLLVRLPQADVPVKVALRGALLAAVGFEILKIVGTYTIAHTAHSPTAGPFASVLAILIWIQLVARWMLFCCAWIATVSRPRLTANTVPVIEPPAMVAAEVTDEAVVSPAAVGAALVGAGAVAGAVTTWLVTRPKS